MVLSVWLLYTSYIGVQGRTTEIVKWILFLLKTTENLIVLYTEYIDCIVCLIMLSYFCKCKYLREKKTRSLLSFCFQGPFWMLAYLVVSGLILTRYCLHFVYLISVVLWLGCGGQYAKVTRNCLRQLKNLAGP